MSKGWKRREEKWEAERQARRAREAAKYGDEMTRVHGAPGNVPPAWIVSASNAWLAARGLDEGALRPFAC